MRALLRLQWLKRCRHRFFVMDYDLNDYNDPAPWNDHSMANSPAPVVAQVAKADGIHPGKNLSLVYHFTGTNT